MIHRKKVKEGYNAIADTYLSGRDIFASTLYLDKLMSFLPKNASILDVGCGAGIPVDSYLLDHGYKVIGIDISEKQIEIAKKRLPQGTFLVKDMVDLKEKEFKVDAIVSFYAIFHIDREMHLSVLQKLASYLPEKGKLLITMGFSDWVGTEDFHGTQMMWSHYDAQKNKEIVQNAGFHLLFDVIDTSGGEKHLILLAEKN